MKAIMVMFDSLNRDYLPPYGNKTVHAPNFARLAEHAVTFDNSYVGSLPCMPARRELHTGRLNFLHRGWSPMEPFDDSMPEILKRNGVYTHLVSDHQHYWEDGGATYHTRYSSWEAIRGQEGDPWKANLDPAIKAKTQVEHNPMMPAFAGNMHRQDAVNRTYMREEKDHCQAQTFSGGLEFLQTNYKYDNWFLQIETFDPHEPFFSCERYENLYDRIDVGREIDWPPYGPCTSSSEVIEHVRNKYKALISMCDSYLGKVLDFMDEHDMWKDTMLIVNTDHGYLLGEHQWWSKTVMPTYNEVAHTPLFIWDPRSGVKGERRKELVQTIDLAPTLLDYFGVEIPKDMHGYPLKDTIACGKKVRDYALFGYHGNQINITDGRYVYMRNSIDRSNAPLYEYTLMPCNMRSMMSPKVIEKAELSKPFSFTKNCPLLKIPVDSGMGLPFYRFGTKLYDLETDPKQENPVDDPDAELRLMNAMVKLMRENDAPSEQFERVGLDPEKEMTPEYLADQRARIEKNDSVPPIEGFEWTEGAKEQFRVLTTMGGQNTRDSMKKYLDNRRIKKVDCAAIEAFVEDSLPAERRGFILYILNLAGRTF